MRPRPSLRSSRPLLDLRTDFRKLMASKDALRLTVELELIKLRLRAASRRRFAEAGSPDRYMRSFCSTYRDSSNRRASGGIYLNANGRVQNVVRGLLARSAAGSMIYFRSEKDQINECTHAHTPHWLVMNVLDGANRTAATTNDLKGGIPCPSFVDDSFRGELRQPKISDLHVYVRNFRLVADSFFEQNVGLRHKHNMQQCVNAYELQPSFTRLSQAVLMTESMALAMICTGLISLCSSCILCKY